MPSMASNAAAVSPSPLPPFVTLLRRGDTYCAAGIGNVLVIVWNEAPTVPALDQVMEKMELMRQRFPDGGAMLVISRANSPGEHGAVKRSAEMLKAMVPWLKAVVAVNGGTGPFAKLVRVMMQTIMALVTRLPIETRLFGTPAETVQWLAGFLPGNGGLKISQGELQSGVDALLAHFPPAGSSS